MFRITMLPAAHGDCLLVEYGERAPWYRILIDGGVAKTYELLRTRLLAIPAKERRVELLVVSHVDADHIEGIVKMLTDDTLAASIGDVWFNGYEHLCEGAPLDFGGVQGEYLSALIQKRKLPWNAATRGRALCVPDEGVLPRIALPGGMTLTLLSPTRARMLRMADVWEEEVKKAGLCPDHPVEALRHLEAKGKKLIAHFGDEEGPDVVELAARTYAPDKSAANGSSIAFLAEYKDKSVLFAADAHAEVLVSSLECLLHERGLSQLKVDAFKLPHHGSRANLSPALLALVRCNMALVSTNGSQFGHPDDEAIARLVTTIPGVRLVFNYQSETNAQWSHAACRRTFGYTTRYPAPNEAGIEVSID